MRLEDKVALITGASSGIGKESALLFAKEGAKIVAVDVNDSAGELTVSEIKAAGRQFGSQFRSTEPGGAQGRRSVAPPPLAGRGGPAAETRRIGSAREGLCAEAGSLPRN